MIDLMAHVVVTTTTRGRSVWRSCYVTDAAYHCAVSRLRKAGVLAYRRKGRIPMLMLTEKGRLRAPEVCRRQAPWPPKWNGIWYLLSYDIPEEHRSYREGLRSFLKEMRMGCLHKSAWITPRDIRPAYDDLAKAARLSAYSHLFEARSVLGRPPDEIVRTAWDMEGLADVQRWYLEVYEDNLTRVGSVGRGSPTLQALLREEISAYLMVMERDPLLPRPLWPDGYHGEEVWQFHRRFVQAITSRL